jgi:hypothetical protein
MITKLLSVLSGPIDRIAARIAPDKDQQQRIAGELRSAVIDNAALIEQAAAKVVLAEAQGESWLQRNWRPLTMLSFVGIIVNNHILYPYLTLFGLPSVMLELDPSMWELIKIGLGGYVVGRSGEKMVKAWKEKP